jgi:hypothetical protein
MLWKWLGLVIMSAGGLLVFQWMYYTGVYDLYKNKAFLGLTFNNSFAMYLSYSVFMSLVMVLPNAFALWISSLAYHEWFNQAWVLYLTFAATSIICTSFIFWHKFAEIPSHGAIVGIALYILGALISALWK